jgi:Mg2+ and Co2+ transporter CorA
MFHEDHLLLILHDVPQPGVPERTALLFWRSPAGAWRSTESGGGLPGLKSLLDRYTTTIDGLEERLSGAHSAKPLFEILRAANPLRRALNNLQVALQQAREMVGNDRDLISMRDRAYDLARAAELLAEETKHTMDYDLALVEEEQARVANQLAKSGHQLNLLAALFFPLTAIASIFGMNMRSGLESGGVWQFWATLAGGLLIGLILRSSINRHHS